AAGPVASVTRSAHPHHTTKRSPTNMRTRSAIRSPRQNASRGRQPPATVPCIAHAQDASSLFLAVLLIRSLMADPITPLVGVGEFTPRLRLHQALRAMHDLELPVLENLADEHRPIGVLIALVDLHRRARGLHLHAVEGLAHRR